MGYKDTQAVVVFVTKTTGEVYFCSQLAGVYHRVPHPSGLQTFKNNLTARQIPWTDYGLPAGWDMAAFGVELLQAEELIDRVASAVNLFQVESMSSHQQGPISDLERWTNKFVTELTAREDPTLDGGTLARIITLLEESAKASEVVAENLAADKAADAKS
jgi:hypothetical protein